MKRMPGKVLAAVLLALRFLKAVMVSGLQTVVVIVRASTGERRPPPRPPPSRR